MDADFEAKRQAFIQRHGADQTLTVRASGGTEGQFRALEATIMRLVRPRGHSMSRAEWTAHHGGVQIASTCRERLRFDESRQSG
jgi:hypothetical protein